MGSERVSNPAFTWPAAPNATSGFQSKSASSTLGVERWTLGVCFCALFWKLLTVNHAVRTLVYLFRNKPEETSGQQRQ